MKNHIIKAIKKALHTYCMQTHYTAPCTNRIHTAALFTTNETVSYERPFRSNLRLFPIK